jgi:hypothetical protein
LLPHRNLLGVNLNPLLKPQHQLQHLLNHL